MSSNDSSNTEIINSDGEIPTFMDQPPSINPEMEPPIIAIPLPPNSDVDQPSVQQGNKEIPITDKVSPVVTIDNQPKKFRHRPTITQEQSQSQIQPNLVQQLNSVQPTAGPIKNQETNKELQTETVVDAPRPTDISIPDVTGSDLAETSTIKGLGYPRLTASDDSTASVGQVHVQNSVLASVGVALLMVLVMLYFRRKMMNKRKDKVCFAA